MRRLTVLFVLAFALALPAIASATEVSGSMNESFTLEAPTISMTVPLNVVYQVTDYDAQGVIYHDVYGEVDLTGIATNNLHGLMITARFSVLTLAGSEPPVTIPTTSRTLVGLSSEPLDLTITGALLAGSIANDATWYQILYSTHELTDASAHYGLGILGVTVPGTYTGSINFVASTNP
jgi:hypothetical protein